MIYLFYSLQILVKLGSNLGQTLTIFPILWAPATTELQFSILFFSLICSQPRDKQNRAHDFLLSQYFFNLLLTVSMQKTLLKLLKLLQ